MHVGLGHVGCMVLRSIKQVAACARDAPPPHSLMLPHHVEDGDDDLMQLGNQPYCGVRWVVLHAGLSIRVIVIADQHEQQLRQN